MQAMGLPSIYTEERAALLNTLKASPGGLDDDLALALQQGVAFHHAGLTTEERECLEDAFHNGVVSISTSVCAKRACFSLCIVVASICLQLCIYSCVNALVFLSGLWGT